MKKVIMLIILVAMALMLPICRLQADEGDSLWSVTYGGTGDDGVSSIIASGDGGYLLAGWTTSFGSGSYDMYLVKINAEGDTLWSQNYGESGAELAYSMTESGDGGFLLAGETDSFGTATRDMWLVKVNYQGDFLWSRSYGGSGMDVAESIIPSGDAGFLLAGRCTSFGAGGWDMWLVKVNAQGDSIWSQTYGGSGDQMAYCIIPSGDGGFLLAGTTAAFGGNDGMWLVKIDSEGDSLWSHIYRKQVDGVANCIIPADVGNFLLAGASTSSGAGYDMYLVKVNTQGDSLWTHTYGGNNTDHAYSVIPSGDGGFLLAGETSSFGEPAGHLNMWLVKVGAQGDSMWSRFYGGPDHEVANAIIPANNGNFLLAGKTGSFGAGNNDMWIVCIEGSGTGVGGESPTINPSSFILSSPHPNPFNPTAILSFELPVASFVSLNVYDISGRLVTTLVSGWREAGRHEVTFDGSGLPSGIYIYRLEARQGASVPGDWQGSGKMVLVK